MYWMHLTFRLASHSKSRTPLTTIILYFVPSWYVFLLPRPFFSLPALIYWDRLIFSFVFRSSPANFYLILTDFSSPCYITYRCCAGSPCICHPVLGTLHASKSFPFEVSTHPHPFPSASSSRLHQTCPCASSLFYYLALIFWIFGIFPIKFLPHTCLSLSISVPFLGNFRSKYHSPTSSSHKDPITSQINHICLTTDLNALHPQLSPINTSNSPN